MHPLQIVSEVERFTQDLREKVENREPLTLGQIEDAVRGVIKESEKKDPYIVFEFAGAYPTTFDSYRMCPRHLALGYSGKYDCAKAKDFLERCKEADGGVFEAWKGGSYQMNSDSEVWVACPGRSSETRIVGVRAEGCDVILETVDFDT